jgi:hypothetical protein
LEIGTNNLWWDYGGIQQRHATWDGRWPLSVCGSIQNTYEAHGDGRSSRRISGCGHCTAAPEMEEGESGVQKREIRERERGREGKGLLEGWKRGRADWIYQ